MGKLVVSHVGKAYKRYAGKWARMREWLTGKPQYEQTWVLRDIDFAVSPGEAVTLSVTPDKGYVLETLVVTDALGKALLLTPLGKGRYSFIMPDSEVTINAAFLNAADVPVSFADVSADDYYYEAVLWAVSQGITLGTDDAHFSPDADCARGQLVTFLWRAAGKPKAEQAALFSDVGADAYYGEAVRWAASCGS